MKYLAILFITVIFSGLSLAQSSAKSNCDVAREKLDKFLSDQTSDCKTDEDCNSFYYRETCRGPVVLAKAIATAEFEKKLGRFKAEIKIDSACAEEWKKSPACSPIPAFPKCKKNHCIDAH